MTCQGRNQERRDLDEAYARAEERRVRNDEAARERAAAAYAITSDGSECDGECGVPGCPAAQEAGVLP